MFNKNFTFYINICYISIQILGDLSEWTSKLSFSEDM